MQVMIGTIEAEVSEDGHDVHLPPPATAKGALALGYLQAEAGHASKPSIDLARWTTAGSRAGAPAAPTAGIGLDAQLGAGLIVCVVIAVIAARSFLKKERPRTITSRSWPDGPMDEAAFLKRYGGSGR